MSNLYQHVTRPVLTLLFENDNHASLFCWYMNKGKKYYIIQLNVKLYKVIVKDLKSLGCWLMLFIPKTTDIIIPMVTVEDIFN